MMESKYRHILFVLAGLIGGTIANAQTLRHPLPLDQQLKGVTPDYLVDQVRLRGDVHRGAIAFYRSAAGCVKCHQTQAKQPPLGPNLALLGRKVSDKEVIESLLYPSKQIQPEYRSHSVLTEDGEVLTGLIAAEDEDSFTLRLTSDLGKETKISKEDIQAIRPLNASIMPEGLAAAMADQREFLDIAAYVIEVTKGGPDRASQLQPTAEQLAVDDDSIDLDHAGIIRGLRSRDFKEGEKIYQGYCFNCHGTDGNKPSLPTARAFGTQKLKFGADPYGMFVTLTRGNGLMAAMSHLTPKQRYQVVHYIREKLMRDRNPDYFKVTKSYLASLPKGTKNGTEIDLTPREFGPALSSQLRRQISSALTLDLGSLTVSYDLHSMDQVEVWKDGFLELADTQHYRPRGEGTANPNGKSIAALGNWRWGHAGRLDYSRDDLLPRGPLPRRWMDYHGYYLHGRHVVLSYAIDGREILELARSPENGRLTRDLKVGPGKGLVVALGPAKNAKIDSNQRRAASFQIDAEGEIQTVSVDVRGEMTGAELTKKDGNLCLTIPAKKDTHQLRVSIGKPSPENVESVDFEKLTSGGKANWPQQLRTVGFLGLETGAYALDTITIPGTNPYNAWLRTSALDFFPDGRMVVTTYGGDVWIVSGIDNDLDQLTWKRFAAGLYEPFGVKVYKNQVYVTCKDRLVRLHDQDQNGEADFYESFSADDDVSVNFHAFNFDLQVDESGNFFYSKSGHGSDSDVPGMVVKISPDGSQRSIYSTGFRTPNGMGILPDGRVTNSDNQGQWMPASKINLLQSGGFYGWVQTYSIPGKWEPGGGKIDVQKVQPPDSFDRPIVWMPQDFDNSSGGQLYVDDERFGPLSNRLLHTSFGKGWLYYLMMQEFGGTSQAAIIKLPFNFRTGIMRARVNPMDGQVYATGLQGWNGGARPGLLENGIQRLRYTGKPDRFVVDCTVEPDGLVIEFDFPLDKISGTALESYQVQHWNYLWDRQYGSEMYSPSSGKVGKEPVAIKRIELAQNGRRAKLFVDPMKPVDQIHIVVKVKDREGKPFQEEIYWTVNRVPKP